MLPAIIHRSPSRRRGADLRFDFDRLFEGLLDAPAASGAFAATDLYETEDGYGLELEVPGFVENEIEVTVDRGVLTITGTRETAEADEGRTYHVQERQSERFTRSFSLPTSVRGEAVVADLASGVLTLTLPKTPEAKPQRIEVGGTGK